jgi:hypothetical protein
VPHSVETESTAGGFDGAVNGIVKFLSRFFGFCSASRGYFLVATVTVVVRSGHYCFAFLPMSDKKYTFLY